MIDAVGRRKFNRSTDRLPRRHRLGRGAALVCVVPVWRALRVDPMVTLRADQLVAAGDDPRPALDYPTTSTVNETSRRRYKHTPLTSSQT